MTTPIKIADHDPFAGFKEVRRNATGYAPCPPGMAQADFAKVMSYMIDRILPPLICRGAFNFEVSVEYRAHAKFKATQPGFGYYTKIHMCMLTIPDDKPVMFRRDMATTQQEHEREIEQAVRRLH